MKKLNILAKLSIITTDNILNEINWEKSLMNDFAFAVFCLTVLYSLNHMTLD